MSGQIVEAWHVNNRVNLRLIDAISDEGMRGTLSKRGGRNVSRQFAHKVDKNTQYAIWDWDRL